MADVDRISVERLDVDNYATWSARMKWLLISKGLWEPVKNGAAEDDGVDQKALALIGLCVKDHHLPTLAAYTTAKEAWDALDAVYKAKSNARRLQLKRELNGLAKSPEEPLSKYVARAKNIRDQLAAAGHVVKDDEVAMSVLAGLPSEFDILATVLETSDEALDLDGLLAKLLTVEQRTSTKKVTLVEDKAYLTTHNRGHPAARRGAEGEQRECFHCGKKGHLQRDCRKKMRDDKAGRKGPGPRQAHPSFPGRNMAMTAMIPAAATHGCWTPARLSTSPTASTRWSTCRRCQGTS